MNWRVITLLLLAVTIGDLHTAIIRRHHSNLPTWVDCVSHLDCAPGYCCTIAFEKYSYPRCQRLHAEGEFCRPSGPLSTNGSRYYPNGMEIFLEDAYLMFCPCGPGLACDHDSAVCRDASRVFNFNFIE